MNKQICLLSFLGLAAMSCSNEAELAYPYRAGVSGGRQQPVGRGRDENGGVGCRLA